MANHLVHINAEVVKSLKEVEQDWAKCSEQVDLARQSKGAYPPFRVLGYTEQLLLIKGLTRSIHRVFIQANDSGAYEKLGWVLRSDVSCCMICAQSFAGESSVFAIFDWSHSGAPEKVNCHACGNVVCKDCVAVAMVTELKSEGVVPVCTQCCFGQEEVSMVPSPALPPSYKLHRRQQEQASVKTHPGDSGGSVVSKGGGGSGVVVGEEGEMPRVWKYGAVALHPITPVFSITAYTKSNNAAHHSHSHHATTHTAHKHTTPTSPTHAIHATPCTTYYINFCSSVHVPYNLHNDCALPNTPLTKKSQELMLLVSERGACSTDSTVYVYDVTLHPTVFIRCSEDSSGVLKERVCAEVLRSIVRLGLEQDFTLFTYNATTNTTTNTAPNSVYNHRLYTVAERVQMSTDIEHYHRHDNKVPLHHTTDSTNITNTTTPNSPTTPITPTSVTFSPPTTNTSHNIASTTTNTDIYSPIPSISAFFHMEQIHILYSHLHRPAGNHMKRWQKYSEITQLSDGTVYMPSNKRVKKSSSVVDVPVPVLVSVSDSDSSASGVESGTSGSGAQSGSVSYSINITPANGFVINTTRVYNGAMEQVLVHVLHSPVIDHITHIMCTTIDDTDPLVFISKRAYKVKGVYSTSSISAGSGVCRAYNVVVGSSYIEGVKPDLTGRRILAAERIDKILRRVNVTFDEHLHLHKYSLTGVDTRPITAPAVQAVYVYDKTGSVDLHNLYNLHARSTHHTHHAHHGSHTNHNTSDSAGITNKHTSTPTSTNKHHAAVAALNSDSPINNTNTNTTNPKATHVRQTSINSVLSDLSISRSNSLDGSNDAHYINNPNVYNSNSNRSSPVSGAGSASGGYGSGVNSGGHGSGVSSGVNSGGHGSGVSSGVNSGASKEKKIRHFFPSSDTMSPIAGANAGGIADRDHTTAATTTFNTTLNGSSSSRSNSSAEYVPHNNNKTNTNTSTAHSITLQGDRTPLGRAKSVRVPVSLTIAEHNASIANTTTSTTNNTTNPNSVSNTTATTTTNTNTTNTGRPPSSRHKSLNLFAFSLRSSSGGENVNNSNSTSPRVTPRTTPVVSPVTSPRATPPPSPRVSFTHTNNTHNTINTNGASSTPNSTDNRKSTKFIPPPLLKSISISSNSTSSRPSTPTLNTPVPIKRANNATVPGDKMVTLEMLQYEVHSSVNRAVAEGINRQSKAEPKLLFGWQIRVHEHTSNASGGVYVVSCVMRKGVVGGHEFRLTSVSGDVWVKLMRGGEGEGLTFTAIRKVMVADE